MKAEIITAADGTALSARVYEPDSRDHGSVVIGGAMGVRQDYYAPFAQWLAGQGWRVTTFDYRGSGDSGPSGSALRGFKADLFDWTRDYEAAIDHAHGALPDRPLYLLDHSLGAQLPGLLDNQAVRLRYANARFPVHAVSITDDELMTLRGTHSLVDLYENAPSEVERLAPADLGVRRLGHFGPFRSEHEAKLWPRMAQWLGALATPRAA